MERAWSEFKTVVMPWLLAAAVIGLILYQSSRQEQVLMEVNKEHAAAVQSQAAALDGIRELLAKQGYTLPPQSGTK